MISLPRTLQIDMSEKIMKKIENFQGDEELEIPVDAKSFAFGGLSTAIQCVNTWARKVENRQLLVRKSVNEYQSKLVVSPHKFVAAMMSRYIHINDSEVQEERGNIRNEINLLAKEAIIRQGNQKYGQNRGPLCWFAFVDHSTKGFDPNFYIKKPNYKYMIRQPEQISSVIQAMMYKSMEVVYGAKPLNDIQVVHMSRIFYELFLNSHEHGTKEVNRKNWIKPGVRVVYTNGLNLVKEAAYNASQKDYALREYINVLDTKQDDSHRFIEIGIIDSGLGYAKRWLADHPSDGDIADLSEIDEYKIFKKCFEFRATSSDDDNKGKGLHAVMLRLTSLKGFMRIRSGRLSLYRNFITHPFCEGESAEFYDWESQKPALEHISLMAEATGVSITLLLPLKGK